MRSTVFLISLCCFSLGAQVPQIEKTIYFPSEANRNRQVERGYVDIDSTHYRFYILNGEYYIETGLCTEVPLTHDSGSANVFIWETYSDGTLYIHSSSESSDTLIGYNDTTAPNVKSVPLANICCGSEDYKD